MSFGHLVFNYQLISIAVSNVCTGPLQLLAGIRGSWIWVSGMLPDAPLLQMICQGASIGGIANHYEVSVAAVVDAAQDYRPLGVFTVEE